MTDLALKISLLILLMSLAPIDIGYSKNVLSSFSHNRHGGMALVKKNKHLLNVQLLTPGSKFEHGSRD